MPGSASIVDGDPVEFMAMLAALASNAGQNICHNVEIRWGSDGKVKFPVFVLSYGNLRRANRIDNILTGVRQLGK